MFFTYPQDFKEKELAPGSVSRIAWGERIMLIHATLQPNCDFPRNSHSHEQAAVILEGELKLTVGNETRVCRKGVAVVIPANVEHSGATGDKLTTLIDIFSPPREEYK